MIRCSIDRVMNSFFQDCFDFLDFFYGKVMDLVLEVHFATKVQDFAAGEEDVRTIGNVFLWANL